MIKEYDELMKLKIPKGRVSREKLIELVEDAGYKVVEDKSPPELRHIKTGKKMKRKPEVVKLKPPKVVSQEEKDKRKKAREEKMKKETEKDELIKSLRMEIAELKKQMKAPRKPTNLK
tara:strand:- start:7762 stop:8115 length:354 start_codon:yes stop_codon:yes gene_type:complete